VGRKSFRRLVGPGVFPIGSRPSKATLLLLDISRHLGNVTFRTWKARRGLAERAPAITESTRAFCDRTAQVNDWAWWARHLGREFLPAPGR
jgi:hypothetical protein